MSQTLGTKVVLIGAGDVGMAYAYTLVNKGLTDHLAIIDVNERKTWGHVQDLNHAVPWSHHNTRVTVGTYEDCRDAALVVNCAGAAQKPGETRLDLVAKNTEIFRSIVGSVMEHGFNGVFLVATNPVDVLSYATWKFSGLPPGRVIGSGTILDTARFRYGLGKYFNVAPTSVHAYVIGEHGDTELPVLSAGSVAGTSIKSRLRGLSNGGGGAGGRAAGNAGSGGVGGADPAAGDAGAAEESAASDVAEIFARTRDAAYEIIQAKGSTSFGIGMGLARITEAVFGNQDVVLPVSALLEGHYGQSGLYIGTPAVINRGGIRHVVELDLDEEEAKAFAHSAQVLRSVMEDTGI